MKRDIIYIVHVGYYEFKFYNPRNALSFAQEAMQSNLEKGGLPVRIELELQWEEPEEEEEPEEADTEDVIDIDSLNLDGGDTE